MSEGFEEIALPDPPVEAEAGAGGSFDQADIDALFGDVGGAAPTRQGLRALIESDTVAQERLPMLEVICDRVIRTFATSMRNLTSDGIEVSLEAVGSGRFGDLMNHMPLPAMFGVFRVPEWDDYGVIVVEPTLITSVVDALLGGRKAGSGQQRIEGRAFTSIETALVGRVMTLALNDFAAAFASVALIRPALERVETSPRFAAIAGPSIATATCTFGVEMEGRGGRFSIMLPHTTLEPVRAKLLQRFMGEKPAGDHSWEAHLDGALRRTELPLRAVLATRELPLKTVQGWAVGDLLRLGGGPDDPVVLQVEGVPLGAGQIGRRGPFVALRLNGTIGGEAA